LCIIGEHCSQFGNEEQLSPQENAEGPGGLPGICESRPDRNQRKSQIEEAKRMRELWKDEEGLTTVEYALLLALVVVAGIAAWQGLGSTVQNTVTDSSGTLANAAS